jgi:radical SAM protein with 4Fe4S-binding SPASM domain
MIPPDDEHRPLCQDVTVGAGDPGPGVSGLTLISQAQRWAHDHFVPLNATLEITQRCNIRCRHCYNFDRDTPRHTEGCGEPELTTDELVRVIGELRDAGCLFLNLTGGEALLHPDLFRLLDHAADLNLAVGLLTNGILLRPGMAGQLARYPNLHRVSISIYGATAETHDGVTQVPGSLARTWAGAERMRDQGIAVAMKIIVMRDNADEVERLMAELETRGFPYALDLTITARNDGTRGSLATRIDQSQLETLCTGPLRRFLLAGPERTISDVGFACNCARGNCAITAQGDVQPCIAVPMVAGNVRHQPFADIWASSPVFQWIRGLRVADYPECAPCPHKSWCTRERGAAYTYSGSYTGTDPLVCARATLSHRLASEDAAIPGAGEPDRR